MIAHARRIDPLTARNPHLEATFLLSLGELERAESLFQRALELDPEFHPSIARLADIAAARGHWIESVKRVEQAIAMDPEAHWMRQQAAWTYLALGDIDAAADVAGEKPSVVSAWVAHERGELDRAAQLVQQLPAETRRRSTGSPELSRAIRDAGLRSGDIEGALRALESVGVDNEFADAYPDIDKLIAQAQLWRRSGREEPAREQIAAALAWLDRVPARAPWPNERRRLRATLLALQGDEPGALAALEQWASARIPLDGYVLEREPAFDAIRATPRFQALIARHRAHVARERAALEEMRARGEVPRRPAR
jgi:tetratricopeptide (TPR) repeat protein